MEPSTLHAWTMITMIEKGPTTWEWDMQCYMQDDVQQLRTTSCKTPLGAQASIPGVVRLQQQVQHLQTQMEQVRANVSSNTDSMC